MRRGGARKAAVSASSMVDIPPPIVEWLERDFEEDADGRIPKHAFYVAYRDCCKANKVPPRDFNIFSKIIYQKFPSVYSRRLGPPRNQIPHFAGVRAKEHTKFAPSAVDHLSVPEIAKYRNNHKRCRKKVKEEEQEEEQQPKREQANGIEEEDGDQELMIDDGNFKECISKEEDEKDKRKNGSAATRKRKREGGTGKDVQDAQTAIGSRRILPASGDESRINSVCNQDYNSHPTNGAYRGGAGEWCVGTLSALQGRGGYPYGGVGSEHSSSSSLSLMDKDMSLEELFSIGVCTEGPCITVAARQDEGYWGEEDERNDSQEPELSRRIVFSMVHRLLWLHFNLKREQELAGAFEARRYVKTFSQVYWPFLPFHWSIVDASILEGFLARGEMEQNVLTLNLLVSLYTGAMYMGNFALAKELYMMARSLAEYLHDEMDLNIVAPLILLAAHAYTFLPTPENHTLAVTFILVGRTICEANNAADSELYCHVMNFWVYLSGGKLPPLPFRRYPLSAIAGFKDAGMIEARMAMRDAINFGLYMRHAIYVIRNEPLRIQDGSRIASQQWLAVEKRMEEELAVGKLESDRDKEEEMEEEDVQQCVRLDTTRIARRSLEQYRPSLVALKGNLKLAHSRLGDSIHVMTLKVIKCVHYPLLAEIHFLMGDMKKALKFAVLHLEMMRTQYVSTSVTHCTKLAEIFVGTGQLQHLEELLRFLRPLVFLKDIEQIFRQCSEIYRNATEQVLHQ